MVFGHIKKRIKIWSLCITRSIHQDQF